MSKYVNVDAFVEALCKTLSTLRKQKDNTPESIAFLKGAQVVAKELMKFPAADVVVRCKNCVHSHPCQEDKTDECCDAHSAHWIKENDHCYDPDAYCSYAEYSCSYCGIWVDDRHGLPEYCPECGKKMKSPLPEPPMEETDNG